jgi:hypothetical protein
MEAALAAKQQPGAVAGAVPSDELRLMREQMAALMAKVERVADPTPAPRRPGRPRKPQPSTEEAA